MYVRVTQSGARRCLRWAEGYRDSNGKVKQRVVANPGRLAGIADEDIDGIIRGLRRALGCDQAPPEMPEFEPARSYGDLSALRQLWQELGLGNALRQALRSSQRRFDAEALIRAMVFNRLAAPRAKRGVLNWPQEDVSLPGIDADERHPELVEQAATEGQEAVTEAHWQGRGLVVAHNPERGAEQTAAQRREVQRVKQLGEASGLR